ncbi:MAG: hypothetical protein V3573_00125 [Desulfovibrionaceae bacterium]
MSKRLKTTVLFLVLLSQLALPAGGAQVSALNDAEKKEFAQNVALPSPAEMFLAINRLGDTDWGEVADFDKRYDYQDNYLRALNLGVRSANGLVAILAEDKNKLGDVIVIVITLAEELMVQETILDRSKTFEDLANQGRWDELRDELDALRYLIEMEMDQLGDQDVATLVRTGGWLEGLHTTSRLLQAGLYPEHSTSLLYQPNLVDYFQRELEKMEPEAVNTVSVQAILKALPEIRSLVNVGYRKPVPLDNVKRLYQLSSELVQLIERG